MKYHFGVPPIRHTVLACRGCLISKASHLMEVAANMASDADLISSRTGHDLAMRLFSGRVPTPGNDEGAAGHGVISPRLPRSRWTLHSHSDCCSANRRSVKSLTLFGLIFAPPLPDPFVSSLVWAKCDMLATVSRVRLDLLRTDPGTSTGNAAICTQNCRLPT